MRRLSSCFTAPPSFRVAVTSTTNFSLSSGPSILYPSAYHWPLASVAPSCSLSTFPFESLSTLFIEIPGMPLPRVPPYLPLTLSSSPSLTYTSCLTSSAGFM